MMKSLKINRSKHGRETHQQFYAISNVEANAFLQHLRHQTDKPLSIIDIGGGCNARFEETTHIVDLLPLEYFKNDFKGTFFQGNIDLSEIWDQLFDYVAKNGKFDFAVCSHTLEDINAPHQAILNLFKIANAGMIAVPSKYIETCKWENLNGPYCGYHHHRWIYTVKNGTLYGYPKMGTLENDLNSSDFASRGKYRQLFGHEGYETQTEMTFLWENSFPVKMISPFMYRSDFDLTENKRSAAIDLLEPDDICALIASYKI